MRLRPIGFTLALLVAACSASTADVPVAADAGSADTGSIDAGSTDAGEAGSSAASCREARGICVGDVAMCTSGGGKWAQALDADCDIFSDGPGHCCLPPAPKPTGTSCADLGGVCAPVGGCLDPAVNGHMTSGACSPIPFVCCVPDGSCPEPRPVCCDATATYRAMCVRGGYVCPSDGMRMSSTGSCD